MNPSDFDRTLSPEEMRRREEGEPLAEDVPLVGDEDDDTGLIRDPTELDTDEELERIKKLTIKKAARYSENYRTTVSAANVCTMLQYDISRATAYNRLESLAEQEEHFYYPHPDTGEKVGLWDTQRDNRPPGERE